MKRVAAAGQALEDESNVLDSIHAYTQNTHAHKNCVAGIPATELQKNSSVANKSPVVTSGNKFVTIMKRKKISVSLEPTNRATSA